VRCSGSAAAGNGSVTMADRTCWERGSPPYRAAATHASQRGEC
jgi:hypothetical protein